MKSWRDSASEQAQADLDGLLDSGLDLARRQLARHGGFSPFALTLSRDPEEPGELVMAGDASSGEEQLADLRAGLAMDRDRLRAAACVALVGFDDGTDGIQLGLEHSEGHAHEILAPFQRRRFPRKVVVGELELSPGTSIIWSGEI